MRRYRPQVEACESRDCPTLVFVFPGNALAAARPDLPSELAADRLERLGDQAIQVSTPPMDSPAAFEEVANYVRNMSQGQPIGLIGFSAGGALALRIAGQPGLDVTSVMDYYGPPDLDDWIASHGDDRYYQYVTSHVHLTPAVTQLFSGPGITDAHVVAAFGLEDHNVIASVSTASLEQDFPQAQVYDYDGPHGVTLYACYAAFQDFLDHLGASDDDGAATSSVPWNRGIAFAAV